MKQSIKFGVLFLMFTVIANAQKIEITPQYGYQVGAKYHYYAGYLKLTGSDQFGITASANLSNGIQAEFFWAQQNASVRIKDYDFFPREEELTNITVNHFQFGAIQLFGHEKAKPFAGASLGWTTFSPNDNSFRSNTKFSIGFTGGAKFYFSDRMGFRLQGQLLMPIEWGSVYIGSGGSGVSAGGSLLQLNFSGGLIFVLGK